MNDEFQSGHTLVCKFEGEFHEYLNLETKSLEGEAILIKFDDQSDECRNQKMNTSLLQQSASTSTNIRIKKPD